MVYGDFKDLAKRIASDKVLRYKAFNIVKTQNMMDIKEVLLLWFINFLIKITAGGTTKNKIKQNDQLGEELHKKLFKKLKWGKVYSPLKDSIRGADLADMQLISKFNEGIWCLLSAIDIISKYA